MNEHPVLDGIRSLIPQFEADTGIKVKVNALAEDLYFDRMEVNLRAGKGADAHFCPMDATAFNQFGAGLLQPLNGFLNEDDYKSVVENMRLKNGELWPMPITLPVNENVIANLNKFVTLTNDENLPIAVLKIESVYKPDLEYECAKVFGTTDTNHPYVKLILNNKNIHYVGGEVTKIRNIPHFNFKELRLEPMETKQLFNEKKWKNVVGFQTRNPMHRSHFELTKYAMDKGNAKLFLNPVVGITQDCDINYSTRVKCYKKFY